MAGRSDKSENDHLRCRICLLSDRESRKQIVNNICSCKGASGAVHIECLEMWIEASDRDSCEVCLQKISIERIPKYGILKSIAIFFYSNRVSQLLVLVMLVSLTVYVLSIKYMDQLTVKHRSPEKKIFSFLANFAIFGSVFVISYSPLICLYVWDLWKEWRKTQYQLRISSAVSNV
ncbi:hypothetical protein V9T40_000068 [Parthenolecanium corni]|uniref:RING-CH-type domain-containing protein n=1 Tax=Parthenolecanium corni TaxID=536013 RepID=A0AAN9Y315_9HEMI